MNVALIGMMGTMKTAVGRVLAAKTGLAFVDTDEEFEREEGRPIREVFAAEGEEYFRDRESAVVKRVSALDNTVISCGGGVPLRPQNVAALQKSASVILLTATPECILARTAGSDARPLLAGGGLERIEALCAGRKAAYERAAGYSLDTTDKTPEEVADAVIALLKMSSGAKNNQTETKTKGNE